MKEFLGTLIVHSQHVLLHFNSTEQHELFILKNKFHNIFIYI